MKRSRGGEGSRATTLPIEVRPFQGELEDCRRAYRQSPTRRSSVCSASSTGAVAVLVRVFGDIDLAEEAVQDAFTTAVAATTRA